MNSSDSSLVWPQGLAATGSHPAKAGDVLIIYATGLGAVDHHACRRRHTQRSCEYDRNAHRPVWRRRRRRAVFRPRAAVCRRESIKRASAGGRDAGQRRTAANPGKRLHQHEPSGGRDPVDPVGGAPELGQFDARCPLTFSNTSIFCARAGNSRAFACGIAIVAALATGFLLPKRYTATATILIDPPAGGDPRIATAVSTVYLESLKTYELLATNDQLFLRAAEQFHLRDHDGSPIESLKRRVLKVDKLRDTRALQISVTLPDPQRRKPWRSLSRRAPWNSAGLAAKEADEATIQDAAKAAEIAKARLNDAESAGKRRPGRTPPKRCDRKFPTIAI